MSLLHNPSVLVGSGVGVIVLIFGGCLYLALYWLLGPDGEWRRPHLPRHLPAWLLAWQQQAAPYVRGRGRHRSDRWALRGRRAGT